jgi:hypothetical protein
MTIHQVLAVKARGAAAYPLPLSREFMYR